MMSHQSTPRSNFSHKQEVIDNFDENNDSLLEDSNSFDLKNQIYELTSKYNNLEYEKNKLAISYENALKEQKQKNNILERLCSEKQEKEEKHVHMINELRAKCEYLAEENETNKKELHSLFEKNRITPDFNTTQFAQEVDVLNELLKKEERMHKLDKELQEAKENEYVDLRDKVAALQRENRKLKDENTQMETQKKESIKMVTQESEDYHNSLIKFKDATIQQLKNEQINLTLQLEEAKKNSTQNRNSLKSDEYSRRRDQKTSQLQQKLTLVQMQRVKLQNEKNQLNEEIKRLQNDRRQQEKAKKASQEQMQLLIIQFSEVRASSFNDKIESKKQINAIKLEAQEEKNKMRNIIEDKVQENRKLREAVLTLNDQNQQLRDKQVNHAKQIEKMMQDNRVISAQNERYLRESNKWQVFAEQSTRRVEKPNDNAQRVADLEQRLNQSLNEIKQKTLQLRQLRNELQLNKQQLNNREEIVEIMKIEKTEFEVRVKEQGKRLKQMEQTKNEKEKVILQLQEEIRTLKDDNRQLQLANQEIKQKLETLRAINSDIQNIKNQLELEKQYYVEMRKEQEELRNKHLKAEEFKLKRENANSQKELKTRQYQPEREFSQRSIEHSIAREEVTKELQALKAQNYELQIKLHQAESEIDRKGIDINMRQEENKKLKDVLSNPRELNLDPLIDTNKKTQFNAVFLQNKIMQVQKQITGLKSLKQKEYEQYKKVYRKRIEDKYLGEMRKSSNYINELQKNVGLLNDKLRYERQANQQLAKKFELATKEGYEAKFQYSQTLEELNNLLQKYKALENQCKQMEFDRIQAKKILDENAALKSYLEKFSKNNEDKTLKIANANEQIQKLNEILMRKQADLRKYKATSPNSSYIGSQRSQQRSTLKAAEKQEADHEPSSDSESLRSWIRRGPNFSRV